jgi:hypothetical protein
LFFVSPFQVAVAERLATQTWVLQKNKYTQIITKIEHTDIHKKKVRPGPQKKETNS